MNKYDEGKISKLQKNLFAIRKVAGWTAEDLGDRIGVTRQTISNLEKSNTTSMTKTQYIAIRAVLDYEIESSQNETLSKLMQILIDDDDLPDEVITKVSETVESIANNTNKKAGNTAILIGIAAVLATIGYGAGGVAGAAMMALNAPRWLEKLMGADNINDTSNRN